MRILFVDISGGNTTFNIFPFYFNKLGVKSSFVMDTYRKEAKRDETWQKKNQENLLTFKFPFYKSKNTDSFSNFKKFLRFTKKFDLIVCTGLSPIWIRFTKIPFIFIATGYELDDIANYNNSLKYAISNFNPSLKIANSRIMQFKLYLAKYLLRSAIKKSVAGAVAPYQVKNATKLGLKRLRFLPHIIDANLFKPMKKREEERRKIKSKLNCDTILFTPTVQTWKEKNFGRYKGNDILIEAFSDYIKSTKKRIKLIMIEKGDNIIESKELIKKLRIKENIIWIKNIEDVSKMIYYYNICDVALGQFGEGTLARIAIEAMSCGCPVISNIENENTKFFYVERPPVLKANNKEEIVQSLLKLENKNYHKRISKDSRKWIIKNCHWENSIKKHIKFYESVINKIKK